MSALRETVRGLRPVAVQSHLTRCRLWSLSFEGEAKEGFLPANAWIELRVADNEFGMPQHVDVTVVSERSRPRRAIYGADDLLAMIDEIDLTPLDGLSEGSWGSEDVVALIESGRFTETGIPRWAWRAMMGVPEVKTALIEAASVLSGEVLFPELFDETLPTSGHLRAV